MTLATIAAWIGATAFYGLLILFFVPFTLTAALAPELRFFWCIGWAFILGTSPATVVGLIKGWGFAIWLKWALIGIVCSPAIYVIWLVCIAVLSIPFVLAGKFLIWKCNLCLYKGCYKQSIGWRIYISNEGFKKEGRFCPEHHAGMLELCKERGGPDWSPPNV